MREGDTAAAEMCAKMMRTSVKSPAVMEELFRPPTKKDLDHYRAERSGRMQSGTGTHVDEEDEPDAMASGGIGVLNGKVVYGPLRPLRT